MITFMQHNWQAVLWSVGIALGAIIVALVVRAVVLWAFRRLAKRHTSILGHSLISHGEGPTRFIFPLIAVLAVAPGLPLPKAGMSAIEHITGLGLIAAVGWLAILFVEVLSDVLAGRYRVDVADNLLARRMQTQFQMLHRIAVILVIIITVSLMLMTFPAIKHIGMSILASAGLASLVVGMAMKGTLANLIAGVQIAFSQPFRIEDAVVVEGEWGWIEEIGTMYVVVRIWDLRRLVLPLSYFLDHPFQNWTRTSADLLGSVMLYTDYSVPVDAVRDELKRICASTPLWRGQVCVVQVSDASDKTIQLRALVDARNSSDAWDLRCLVREKLIEFLQKNYPESLPRYRAEVGGQPAQTARELLPGS
ncbi:MAG: mechanosensitive ion channel family protein [Acidobacteriota bacterium]